MANTKGARVHHLLWYVRIKENWHLQITEKGHNYAFILKYPQRTRAVILVNRTSKRCFRVMYWNVDFKIIEYYHTKTHHATGQIINQIMATIPYKGVSIIQKGEQKIMKAKGLYIGFRKVDLPERTTNEGVKMHPLKGTSFSFFQNLWKKGEMKEQGAFYNMLVKDGEPLPELVRGQVYDIEIHDIKSRNCTLYNAENEEEYDD